MKRKKKARELPVLAIPEFIPQDAIREIIREWIKREKSGHIARTIIKLPPVS